MAIVNNVRHRDGKKGNGLVKVKLANGAVLTTAEAVAKINAQPGSLTTKVDGKEVDIHVINGAHGSYISTDRDGRKSNNLEELPTF